ncbi:MAG: NUDIX domain-containing protein [Bacilli bacterium]|nr:NUDIX domain-containing protein [Bacilli bacterium]
MEELVDEYNELTEEKTGKIISKETAHSKGIWHSAIHIIMINKDKNKVLLQKRCQDKKLYPNMWDITVGGHISAGEDSLVSAKREFKEELGLNLDDYEYKYLDKIKEEFYYENISSKEFVYVYLVIGNVRTDSSKLQKEEVSDANWFTKNEFQELITANKIIKHDKEFKIIEDLLN